MRAKVLGELQDFRSDLSAVVFVFVVVSFENLFQIVEPEADAFGDGLGGITGEENIVLSECE